MVSRIYAIARNTLFETIRQPVFAVVLAGALCLIAFSPAFTMFTLVNHIKLVKDMGLATIMLTGLLLAVLAASTVISEEIRKQTALTVVSKPVDRFEFILGKYFGIVFSLLIAGYLMTIVLTMTVRVGVPATASTKLDSVAIWGMVIAFGLAVLGATIANYFFDRPFPSTSILMGLAMFSLAYLVVGFLPPIEDALKETTFHYDHSVTLGGLLIMLATTVLAAVAIAASSRLNPLLTLAVCAGFFVLGLVADSALGRFADGSSIANVVYHAVFNLQVFWIADGLSDGRSIPAGYVVRAGAYAVTYQAAVLFFAMFLFQNREIAR